MTAISWAVAGQIAVGIVIGVFALAWVLAYRAARADEDRYRDRRFIG